MIAWWLILVLAAAAAVPVCAYLERRDDRLERERWDRLQMRAERLEFYRKAAKR